MDLKNMTMDDLKEKFAAFDRKTLIKFELDLVHLAFNNLFCNPKNQWLMIEKQNSMTR